jgi:glutathionylspermidine synthase
MQRVAIAERPTWRSRAKDLGFQFHSPDGSIYWDERAYWQFTLREIEEDLEAPAAEIEALCRDLLLRVTRDDKLFLRLRIPKMHWELIRESYKRGDPSLYGRFDFSYDGQGPAKLLEYNADTPTSLYETSVFQWYWLEEQRAAGKLPGTADQFNSIHERLVSRFRDLSGAGVLHLTCVETSTEDRGTVDYIAECAQQGGFPTEFIAIGDIGTGRDGQLYDLQNRPIERLFKLYPWEWLFREQAAKSLTTSYTGFLEPPWKAILSNKGILPLLWDMAPNHPNLLESYFEDDPRAKALDGAYVRKPLYSREGANIEIVRGGRVVDSDAGPYGAEGFIRQALAPLPMVDGNHAVLGLWMVTGEPAGLGIREDNSAITKNTSRFVPHAIVG